MFYVKKHGENKFKYFLYRYPRTKTYKYNFQKIEVYNLDKLSSQTGKLLYTEVTTNNGCYEITAISVNCGEGGNHSNGAFCEALNYSMALDYIVIKNNCPESGGGPGDNNSGYYPGSPEDGGGSYDGNGTIAVPVEPIKKWNAGRFSVVNFLGLNYEQLRFMNAIENDEFRYEMVEFFNRNGIENPLENPSSEILSQEAVNVGKWIISYSMSNTMFLNSEYRNSFLKESLVFQNWSKNILTQNPNTNWDEFLSWFSLDDQFNIDLAQEFSILNKTDIDEYISINKELDLFNSIIQNQSFDPLDSPWLKKAREIAQKLQNWSRFLGPKAKQKANELIDNTFIVALNKTAKTLYPNVGNISELEKEIQLKSNGKNGVAILLYDFANGVGKDRRDFSYEYNITQQFIAGNVATDIKNDFNVQLGKKGLSFT